MNGATVDTHINITLLSNMTELDEAGSSWILRSSLMPNSKSSLRKLYCNSGKLTRLFYLYQTLWTVALRPSKVFSDTERKRSSITFPSRIKRLGEEQIREGVCIWIGDIERK